MRRVIIWTFVLTVIWEVITLILRFAAGLESTRDTAPFLSQLFLGYRIHHSYVGALMLPFAWLFARTKKKRPWAWTILVVGLSLIFSDLIHHFCVLWPVVGDPQFDFYYPPTPQ